MPDSVTREEVQTLVRNGSQLIEVLGAPAATAVRRRQSVPREKPPTVERRLCHGATS